MKGLIVDMNVYELGPDGPIPAKGRIAEIIGGMADRAIKSRIIASYPVTLEQAMWLFNGLQTVRIGDVLKLREPEAGIIGNFKWPRPEDECVVSRISSDSGWVRDPEQGIVHPENITLLFQHFCGDKDCPLEGNLVEYGYDSRYFRVVGNIYAGYVPKNTRKHIPD